MTDFSKLKKASKFGAPPSIDEVKNNLEQPEAFSPPSEQKPKSNRVHPIGLRVTKEFYRRIRMIALRDNLKIVELFEKTIEVYEETRKIS